MPEATNDCNSPSASTGGKAQAEFATDLIPEYVMVQGERVDIARHGFRWICVIDDGHKPHAIGLKPDDGPQWLGQAIAKIRASIIQRLDGISGEAFTAASRA